MSNDYERIVDTLRSSLREEIHSVLLGQVLTIIDSSITDKQQNKAVKDLIKGRFYKQGLDVMEYMKSAIYNIAKKNGQEIKGDQSENFEVQDEEF